MVKSIQLDSNLIIQNCDFDKLSNSTIFISGASGMLGIYFSYCLKKLLDSGYTFQVYLQHYSKLPDYFNDFFKHKYINLIQLDLSKHEDLKKIPKCDFVIHGAGYAQPNLFMKNRIDTIKINSLATLLLLELLNPEGHFLYLSSSDVYRGLKVNEFEESQIGPSMFDHPRSSYIESKKIGESIVNLLSKNNSFIKSARIKSVYGPGTKKADTRVLNSFIQKAIEKNKIDLIDSGYAMHTYIYISDAIEILWKILLQGNEKIYNVGGNSNILIRDLAFKIGKILNVPVSIPNDDHGLLGAPHNEKLDLNKILNEFNKVNFIDLDTGLLNTIEWQKYIYNI